MNWVRPARAVLTLALAGAAFVAAPQALARRRPPPVVEAPPPPPPEVAPPPVLSQRGLSDAAGYQAYLERVTATSPTFTSGAGVAQALKDGAAYSPKGLIRGAVAYAAIAALKDAEFVASVRVPAASAQNRGLIGGYLVADPYYAFRFKGSDGAAGFAKEALGEAGLQLYAAGKTIKTSAYQIQRQPWSNEEVADRAGRLAAVEASGANPPPPADDHIAALRAAVTGTAPLPITASPIGAPYPYLVARALQLAAFIAMGEAGDEAYDRLAALAVDDITDTCLHRAKLNLFQCLAVAKPNYEDVFCLGEHAMTDTGSCLARNVGVVMPLELYPRPLALPAIGKARGGKAKGGARRRRR